MSYLGTNGSIFWPLKGQKIDPFVPKYDIMKIQDLSKDVKKSQKIYVQSPRFIKTLERALIAILEEADTGKTGELSYQEFYDAFKKLQNYDLSENDLRTLLALADEKEKKGTDLVVVFVF